MKRVCDLSKDPQGIFLLWDGAYPDPFKLMQIRVCLRSINRHEPEANVYLFSNVLSDQDLLGSQATIVRWDYTTLGQDTALEGRVPNAESNWCVWSDLFRIICLWRWGGTYFDVDDIMIRPLPKSRNVMAACFLTIEQHANWQRDSVISGDYAMSKGKLSTPSCFRFGADPMTNFDARNRFLEKWLEQIIGTPADFWGQVLPSRIFAADAKWAQRHVNPIPWSDLLFHPYDGGHHPQDQRYLGNRIATDQLVTAQQYGDCWNNVLGTYDFYLVKNHMFACQKNAGEVQQLLQWVVQDLWSQFGFRMGVDY